MTSSNNWLDADPKSLIGLLRKLASDLEEIDRAGFPNAPSSGVEIDGWAIFKRAVPCLLGTVTGHPTIAPGHPAATTELYYIDLDRGYARTLNSWYKLRTPIYPSLPASKRKAV